MLSLIETERLREQLLGIRNLGSSSVSLTANPLGAIAKAVTDSAAGHFFRDNLFGTRHGRKIASKRASHPFENKEGRLSPSQGFAFCCGCVGSGVSVFEDFAFDISSMSRKPVIDGSSIADFVGVKCTDSSNRSCAGRYPAVPRSDADYRGVSRRRPCASPNADF